MRMFTLAVSVAGICAITTANTLSVGPLYTYNASPSAPLGWYKVEQNFDVRRGDYLLATLPHSVQKIADQRQYLPSSVPLLKQVFALTGDHICIKNNSVFVDQIETAPVLTHDRAGRKMPQFSMCRRLQDGEYFLLNLAHKGSFDSRYYGPVTNDLVIGNAIPLWTWDNS